MGTEDLAVEGESRRTSGSSYLGVTGRVTTDSVVRVTGFWGSVEVERPWRIEGVEGDEV